MPQPASPIAYSTIIPTLIAAALQQGGYEIKLPTKTLAERLRFQIYGYLRRLPEGDLTKLNFREYSIKIRDQRLIIEHREANSQTAAVTEALIAALGPEAVAAAKAEAEQHQIQAQMKLDGAQAPTPAQVPTLESLDLTFDPKTFKL